MQIIEKKLTEIKPYERNPRKNTAAVDKVAASIEEFGFKVPLVITTEGEVVAGHTRLKAAEKLGMKTVPCIIADDLTPEQIRAFRLADNKVAEFSSWDEDLLEMELGAFSEIDMSVFGFDGLEAEESPDNLEEDDFNEKKTKKHNVEAGQIWVCGKHRVMCGDSTIKEDADRLMDGELGDFVFTDPPYGVAIGDKNKMLDEVGGGKSGRIKTNIEGDTLPTNELYEMLVKAMTNIREHCKDSASYYVSSPQGGEIGMMMMMMRDAGLEVRHNLIWVKSSATFSMGRLDYDYRHEPIFYTWTKRHTFYGGNETTVIDDTDDTTVIDKMTKEELKEALRAIQFNKPDTVIYCNKPRKCDLHPTMKPVKLVGRLMINSSKKGDAVLDFFGGSGTTMIAAEQLERRAFLMEKDPQYVDVILTRWEEFTGQQAQLIA